MEFTEHNHDSSSLSGLHSEHMTYGNHLCCHYCDNGDGFDLHSIGDGARHVETDTSWPFDLSTDHLPTKRHEGPFPFIYLVHLFTAPDMRAFLAGASISDDAYAMPIHLQRLVSEAKEEVVLEKTDTQCGDEYRGKISEGLARLERLRKCVWLQSGGDVANLMSVLTELMNDDDELASILGW